MIRPLTCVCLLLAGGSGLYLYQSKHRAQMLDREIERTLKATDTARGRIGALRGEWTLLNESERLAALSQSHLELKALAPSQYVTAAELGVRLPPPAAPGTIYTPGEEEATPAASPPPPAPAPAVPPVALHPILAVARAQPSPPAVPPRPPTQLASVLQPPSSPLPPPRPIGAHPLLAPLVNVSTIVSSLAPRPAAPRPTPPAANAAATTAANAAGPPIGESVARMARLQAGVPAAGVAAPAPQPAYNAPTSNQPITSALGGVRPLLPPPVPYGSAMAASASAR